MSKLIATLTPADCAEGIRRHFANEHVHKVLQGFFFMQAQANYSQKATKKRPTVGRFSDSEPENPGFDQWIEETFRGVISRSTAFNYMTAAARCGITLEMTEEAAQAAAAATLAGTPKLSDLYKALPDPDAPPPAKEPPNVTPGQLFFGFMGELDDFIAPESPFQRNLPKLSIGELEDMERKLSVARRAVQEALTAVKTGAKKGGK